MDGPAVGESGGLADGSLLTSGWVTVSALVNTVCAGMTDVLSLLARVRPVTEYVCEADVTTGMCCVR